MTGGRVPLREIARLAGPALPVLAAEPLYLLIDTAVVGRLGAVPLAGLAVAAVVFAQVTSQLNFLSYGTTARAARLHGAGRRSAAVGEGVQATWLALAVGLLVLGVGQLVAGPVTRALGDGGAVAASRGVVAADGAVRGTAGAGDAGRQRVDARRAGHRPAAALRAGGQRVSALLCAPLVHGLGAFAGLGLVGSAVANVAGQAVGAGLFLPPCTASGPPPRRTTRWRCVPCRALLRAQLTMGRDLLARSLAFQACFLSAAAVAARFGAATVAAHQVVLQLWFFMALVLDAVAIAAQALVGAALGRRGRAAGAGAGPAGRRLRAGPGSGFGALFAALAGVLPRLFTTDPAVLAAVPAAWWFFAGMQPLAGVVFALDGVLLGAGDAAFLRTWTLVAAAAGFLPMIWASLAFGWGLVGIWTGLAAVRRPAPGRGAVRVRSGRWAVAGAVRT